MTELFDNMIKSAMTLETKRWKYLSWEFPFNNRKVREGETIDYIKILSEGIYRWSITSLPGEIVETTHESPYSIDSKGDIHYYEPSLRKREVFAEEINGFGPDDKPWRWVERRR